MKGLAIIGGGISGLSAAYFAQKHGLDYTLYEAAARLGGIIRTEHVGDFVVEAGPDSYLTQKLWARDLAWEVGLSSELIYSRDSERKTYIAVNGVLLKMPVGMQLMVPTDLLQAAASPLLSLRTKLRIVQERLFPPEPLPEGTDESVARFTERHFGHEMVVRIADPLLAGVYGGDSANLSARAVIPTLVDAERKYRSLTRGLLTIRKQTRPRPIFTSFRRGMQQFVDGITAKLDSARIRTSAPVHTLLRDDTQWQMVAAGQTHNYSNVLLAVPAHAAAVLLEGQVELAQALRRIRFTSSITVSLIDVGGLTLPSGFGFLVPRSAQKSVIACTFMHNKFESRAPEGKLMLRAFLTSGLEQSDTQLLETVLTDIESLLGSRPLPAAYRITRWPNAMPQYEVGHLDRVAKIERIAGSIPGLHLIGNSYRGIGIPDCIREANIAVQKIVANAK